MPFTPTHMVAVLPIAAVARRWLPLSALAIGSMVPDWPLFAAFGPRYAETHSIPGLVTACLPLGLACYLCFQILLKRPLVALLPRGVRLRIGGLARPCLGRSATSWLGACAAIVVGAFTHMAWDTFTHPHRWGTQTFPGLNLTAFTVLGRAVPAYKALQYGSSLVGLPALALLAIVWLRRAEPTNDPASLPTWLRAGGLIGLIAAPLAVAAAGSGRAYGVEGEAFRVVTDGGAALGLATPVYATIAWACWRGRA